MYFDQVEFGRRLRIARQIKNLTQSELADILGVDRLHISRMERGVVACSIDLLLEISNQLGVTTDFLLKGENVEECNLKSHLNSVVAELTLLANRL